MAVFMPRCIYTEKCPINSVIGNNWYNFENENDCANYCPAEAQVQILLLTCLVLTTVFILYIVFIVYSTK